MAHQRVLVADDDDDIRFLVGSILERAGWTVTEASSGVEAIGVLDGLAADAAFDVLVLDQNMPPGSGIEVVEWLRERADATPVVLFTGFVTALDEASVSALGARVLDKVAIKQLPRIASELAAG